jgi:antirestriction protein ArdC
MMLFTGSATSTATEAYFSTVLHELTHWTAPAHRCNRDLSGWFGSEAYAMEELVAELGAAFLCAELGITVEPRTRSCAAPGALAECPEGRQAGHLYCRVEGG